jgi:Icc-related predicted phosphoesterase
MMIAALGDVHGKWREAMDLVDAACASAGIGPGELTAIFQVGDAEPQRDEVEAAQVPGPAKYRKLGDFADVAAGEIVVPAPLYFIAGNHEPFGVLDADGGLAAGKGRWGPNVTYLGRAGLVEVAGLRVGFLSGIFGEGTFRRAQEGALRFRTGKHATHYLPSELEAVRSATADGVDVLLTHDWPTGVADVGHFGATGDERVRALIEDRQPVLSLHGHMHRPGSAVVAGTQVECLAIVGYRSGDPMAAVGVWDIDPSARTATRMA